MSEHTQGPWHTGGDGTIIYDSDGWGIANATVFHGRREPDAAQANARRIVACVNACDSDGLPTAALEALVAKGGRLKGADWYVDMLDRQLEQAEEQRDALLAALEAIAADDFAAPHDATDADISYEKGRLIMRTRRAAQSAIAAAKAGAQ